MKMKRSKYSLLMWLIVFSTAIYFITLYPDASEKKQEQMELSELPAVPIPLEEDEVELEEIEPEVTLSRDKIYPGDYVVVFISPLQEGDTVEIASDLAVNPLPLFRYKGGRIGLVPVNYRTNPGKYNLEVIVSRDVNLILKINKEVSVLAKDFPVQELEVSPDQREKRNEKLWQEDREHTRKARSIISPEPLWEGRFIMPAEGEISTEYGTVRYINGVDSGRHSGLDIAAPIGTPIVASNRGVVTLAKSLNVTGKTVIIHHGFNLFTSYSHLDKLVVEAGQEVRKGEVIGTVGSTGFSTGPHLHWSILIGADFVNPLLFLKENLLDLL